MKKKSIIIILISCFSLFSCIPAKEVVYFQGTPKEDSDVSGNYEPLIQSDDMLVINIFSEEKEAAIPFNIDEKMTSDFGGNTSNSSALTVQKQTYLVDNQGRIDFPVLGSLPVSGLSITELKKMLIDRLSIYIKNPIINVRIYNFKVSVLGEVNKPGIVKPEGQRLTLLEAISECGDLTMYGRRDNVLIIRDFQGKKTYNRVNITKASFINSPFYYLDQNDVIYVEPRKSKIETTPVIGPNVTAVISIVGFVLTTILLITKK